jgi:NAD(P)-dependent dehydrogenase (short-subunit alcohol dehydrogenase family)
MLSTNDILLTDKVAFIAGGAYGIGGGVARNFARFGAKVVVADKDAESGRETAAAINRAEGDGTALFVHCDIRRLDQVEQAVDETMSLFGRLDILVNNAGGVRRVPFLDLGPRGWHRHMELNMIGLYQPTDLAVRAMLKGGRGGSIINVSSIEAFRAAPDRSVYAACKAAMVNFTRTLALELGLDGIRVNGIAPDVIATPGIRLIAPDGTAPKERLEALARHVPLGRAGDIDDTAGACLFLASDLARYITGVTIPVDGGTWASSGWSRDKEGRWHLFEGFADAYST